MRWAVGRGEVSARLDWSSGLECRDEWRDAGGWAVVLPRDEAWKARVVGGG